MVARRYFSAMTLLADNTILVTGGIGENGEALDSAEIYNPTAGNFYLVGRMTTARRGHNAVLLKNGRVLIAGGDNAVGIRLASAEIFDPIERTFSLTGEMNEARLTEHTPNAVVLRDGRVLIAGGYGTSGQLASVEVYDPDRGTFILLGNMAVRRACQSLTVLNDGRDVLIAGGHADGAGHLDSAEIYSPDSHSTMLITKMNTPHFLHTATPLTNGKVLIIGGYSPSVELYDPDTQTFKEIGCLTTSRYLHTTILLSGGEVLVIGGADHTGRSLASIEGGTIL